MHKNVDEIVNSPTLYVIFCKKILLLKLLLKCWWNWLQVSISHTFYKQLFHMKVFAPFLSAFNFGLSLLVERKLVQKLFQKCWCNCFQDSISSTFYACLFRTKANFSSYIWLCNFLAPKFCVHKMLMKLIPVRIGARQTRIGTGTTMPEVEKVTISTTRMTK